MEKYFNKSLSAEAAAGQLFLFGFDGTRYEKRLERFFAKVRPGGVILFSANIENESQTKTLISDLKKLGEDTTGLPIFVCIDQEGGRVSRLSSDLPTFPTARLLGEDGSKERVTQVYRSIGDTIGSLGFNTDFAPVADVDTNIKNPVIGDRSFSSDHAKVSALAPAAIEGLSASGILSCAKHFPGHGDTTLDSHLDLPVDERPKERFYEVELAPFRAVIEAKVDFIMTAHVVYPAFDKVYPATLSKKIITDLLRHELCYEGIIVGDDLDMKAITDRYDDAEACRLSFEAGADMAMVCHESPRRINGWEAIRAAIDSGEFSQERLYQSLNRILSAKTKVVRPLRGAE